MPKKIAEKKVTDMKQKTGKVEAGKRAVAAKPAKGRPAPGVKQVKAATPKASVADSATTAEKTAEIKKTAIRKPGAKVALKKAGIVPVGRRIAAAGGVKKSPVSPKPQPISEQKKAVTDSKPGSGESRNYIRMSKSDLLAITAKHGLTVDSDAKKSIIIAAIRDAVSGMGKSRAAKPVAKTPASAPAPAKQAVTAPAIKPAGKIEPVRQPAAAPAPKANQKPAEPKQVKPATFRVQPISASTVEEAVEQSKYYIGAESAGDAGEFERYSVPPDALPAEYGDNRLVLLARDPLWLHSFWDVPAAAYESAAHRLGTPAGKARVILRVYEYPADETAGAVRKYQLRADLSGVAPRVLTDIEITGGARNWYINLDRGGMTIMAELGLMDSTGKFEAIVRSNIVRTPSGRVSDIVENEWSNDDDQFRKVYGRSAGMGDQYSDDELIELLNAGSMQLMRRGKMGDEMSSWMGSHAVSSFGLSSGEIFGAKKEKQRKFRFWLNAELIVYGGTEPDAKVTLKGKQIQLRPDGTFTARYALPDGVYDIPATAESADGVELRMIAPTVTRSTAEVNTILKDDKDI